MEPSFISFIGGWISEGNFFSITLGNSKKGRLKEFQKVIRKSSFLYKEWGLAVPKKIKG